MGEDKEKVDGVIDIGLKGWIDGQVCAESCPQAPGAVISVGA
jgi:hypothetical protein